MIKADAPSDEKSSPYAPPAPAGPLVFEHWQGLNTATDRAGVPDQQAYWLDGFFPLAPRRLRTLPGVGPPLVAFGGGTTVVMYKAFNIKAVPYLAVLVSDGSVVAVRTDNGGTVVVLLPGTIVNPTIATVDFSQFGQAYLLIVAKQFTASGNGYWVWDGTLLYGPGTLGPQVTLTAIGTGYQTAPSVTAIGGHGSGATFVATVAGGIVTNVTIASPGTGYQVGDVVTLGFTGGQVSGTGAVLTLNMGATSGSGAVLTLNMIAGSGGFVVSTVTVNAGGSNFSPYTTIQVTGGNQSSQFSREARLSPVIVGGVITSVSVVDGGFYGAATPVPTAGISDTGNFFVANVTVNNGGSNYSPSASIAVTGGSSPRFQASLRPVILGGVITSVIVGNGGAYAAASPVPTAAVNDVSVTAAATVTLMPFGVQGNAVETYAGHVWVADGPLIQWTAPGSVSDFATSDGGGNLSSIASTLRVGYTRLVATNGFLYLVGDSSVDYISGVQTTGSPPTTTFTLQNADPEVGTPFPATVMAIGQGLVFANSWGVQELVGSTVQKVSEMLDGVYGTRFDAYGNLIGGAIQPCMAKAVIFDKKVEILLLTIVDPVLGVQQNKLLLRYGKIWFASVQDVAITFIATQEINSQLTCWGTNGTVIYPLFITPSAGFLKVAQTRLWDTPGGIEWTKAAVNLWGLANVGSLTSPGFTVRLESERGGGNTYTFTPTAPGYYDMPPQAVGEQGLLTGLTIQTSAADLTFVTFKFLDELVQYRG